MPITIVRRPKPATALSADIRAEVKPALENLAKDAIDRLEKELDDAGWTEKPDFKYKIIVNTKRWQFIITIDKRKKMGQIYTWVDEGVGEYGGKTPLADIVPKKAKFLGFTAPHQPLTLPNPPISGFPSHDKPRSIRTKSVHHPGIYPRNFTKTMTEWLRRRPQPGAFKSTVDAAIKRAIRKSSRRK